MPKVYIVQESPGKNLLPARDMGELFIMLTLKDIDQGFDHCVRRLQHVLSHMQPLDSLLPIGDPILIGVATAIASQNMERGFSILRWDRESYCYEPIFVKL